MEIVALILICILFNSIINKSQEILFERTSIYCVVISANSIFCSILLRCGLILPEFVQRNIYGSGLWQKDDFLILLLCYIFGIVSGFVLFCYSKIKSRYVVIFFLTIQILSTLVAVIVTPSTTSGALFICSISYVIGTCKFFQSKK